MKNAVLLPKEASASPLHPNEVHTSCSPPATDPARYLELWNKVFQILHGNPKI